MREAECAWHGRGGAGQGDAGRGREGARAGRAAGLPRVLHAFRTDSATYHSLCERERIPRHGQKDNVPNSGRTSQAGVLGVTESFLP